jgi:cytochrome c-type biogenesis protein CcmH/NrfF
MRSLLVGIIAGVLLFTAPVALLVLGLVLLVQRRPRVQLIALGPDPDLAEAIDHSPNVVHIRKH